MNPNDNIEITIVEETPFLIEIGETGPAGLVLVSSVNGEQGNVVLDKTDIGLANVDNTSDANKPISTAQATAIALKADKTYVDTQDALKAPQATTYTKTESDTKDAAVASTAQTNLTAHTGNTSNPHAVTKAQVGLANVDNTSDANKPVSTAQATAIALKANTSALAPVATSGVHNSLTGLSSDDHPQYMTEPRGDARYANKPYAVMAKALFGNLATTFGIFGSRTDNTGYINDLVVYGQSTQASTPTPDVPVSIVSTTGNVAVRSDNKNLLQVTGGSSTSNGVTFTVNADKSVTVTGTATGGDAVRYNAGNIDTYPIKIVAGKQYTITGAAGGDNTKYILYVGVVYNSAPSSAVFYKTDAGQSKTFTATEDGWANSGGITVRLGQTVNNLVFYPQLEVGPSSTALEKNVNSTQIIPLSTTKLRSLPNGVSDRIYKSAGNWWFEQNVGNIILDGTESWTVSTSTGSPAYTYAYTSQYDSLAVSTTNTNSTLSNMFDGSAVRIVNTTTVTKDTISIGAIGTALTRILILTSRLSSNDNAGVRAWLAANLPSSIFLLPAPITTQITNPTQITALENIRTYQGITNITAGTPISGSYGVDSGSSLVSLANKIDKTSVASQVYVTNSSGAQTAITYSSANGANTMAQRSTGGTLSVGVPTAADHATRKDYVDDKAIRGTGFPEGVVTAAVGISYIDTNATNGAVRWYKATGSGNTGWKVSQGDTGWRDITSLFTNMEVVNGNDYGVYINRNANNVMLTIKAQLKGTWSDGFAITLPPGFYCGPGTGKKGQFYTELLQIAGSGRIQIQAAASIIFVSATVQTAGTRYYGSIPMTVRPEELWPTTLPGSAAS